MVSSYRMHNRRLIWMVHFYILLLLIPGLLRSMFDTLYDDDIIFYSNSRIITKHVWHAVRWRHYLGGRVFPVGEIGGGARRQGCGTQTSRSILHMVKRGWGWELKVVDFRLTFSTFYITLKRKIYLKTTCIYNVSRKVSSSCNCIQKDLFNSSCKKIHVTLPYLFNISSFLYKQSGSHYMHSLLKDISLLHFG